jgi:CelD/BcsL family acetyltransferase involved in cellulose biosynthesis
MVTVLQELEELAPAWTDLLGRSASQEAMLGPTWLLTWWRVYASGNDRQLRVALLHDGERLVGLAPLQRRRYRYRPGIPFRRLEFLGADVEEQDGVCSDYLNIIAEHGQEKRVADALAHSLLRGTFGSWDELVLSAMDGEGPMPDLLVSALGRAGLATVQTVTGEAPYLRLPATWDQYLAELPKKKRYGLLRAERDLETWAEGSQRFITANSPCELEQGQRILADLHNERWNSSGQRGAFQAPRFAAFHDALMPRLLEQGQLELTWLSVREEPVAAQYNIVASGKVYYYQCGRRIQIPKGQRPGVVLLAHAIRRAIAAGRREFDFLAGASPYKMELTQTTRPLVQVRAVRRCVAEKARVCAEHAIAWARVCKRRFFGNSRSNSRPPVKAR